MDKNGELIIGGLKYRSVSYSISGNNNIDDANGMIIERGNLRKGLNDLTDKLDFSENEKEDFIDYWMKNLPQASYYQVGLLDQNYSRTLTNWTTDPQPDTEINYIFYFKPLVENSGKITAQEFSPIQRKGFTVVDIGGIVVW